MKPLCINCINCKSVNGFPILKNYRNLEASISTPVMYICTSFANDTKVGNVLDSGYSLCESHSFSDKSPEIEPSNEIIKYLIEDGFEFNEPNENGYLTLKLKKDM